MPGRGDKFRGPLVLAALAVALLAAVVAGVSVGAVPVSATEIVGALARAIRGTSAGLGDTLVVSLRLPRVLLAALVGACLAAAGVLYQALFRNPLADPYILGVSSGAGLGATVALTVVGVATVSLLVVPAAAFAGALGTVVLVAVLATRRGVMDTLSLLLAGVAVSYTLSALTSFAMVVNREQMSRIVFWMMGGLQSASWEQVGVVSVLMIVGLIVPFAYLAELDVMLLGDERAGQLGVEVERVKRLMLASASVLVAAAVSVSGLIGFVGLMTPHMVRIVLGPRHRLLLPASLLGGAIVLVVADLFARTVIAPIELPVGIVTALVGGPVFVWLLVRSRRTT